MAPKKKVAAATTEETPSAPIVAADAPSPSRKRSRKDSEAEDDAAAASPAPARRSSSSGGPVITEEMVFEGTVPFERLTTDSDFDAKKHWKILTWNVAGLRALLKKDGDPLAQLFKEQNPDVVCLQETKLNPDDKPEVWRGLGVIPGYTFVDNVSVAKKGYSGTRTYVKDGTGARADFFDFDVSSRPDSRDPEGRVVTTLWNHLAIVNSYVPNSGMELDRLDYRVKEFDPMMRKFLQDISSVAAGPDKSKKGAVAATAVPFQDATGGTIWTGDLNVAERDFDRFWGGNFKQMQKSPGFTPEERASFRQTLSELDMVDAFRALYPKAAKVYSFWSARFDQRAKNNGWRLDYFVVSRSLAARVVDCFMLPKFTASDHCPIVLWLKK